MDDNELKEPALTRRFWDIVTNTWGSGYSPPGPPISLPARRSGPRYDRTGPEET